MERMRNVSSYYPKYRKLPKLHLTLVGLVIRLGFFIGKRMIEKALEAKAAYEKFGTYTAAARDLGIARSTLMERLRKLAHSGDDGLAFRSVPFGHHVKGVSTLYDGNGLPRAQWVKTRTDAFDPDAFVEYLNDALKDHSFAPVQFNKPQYLDSEVMMVYPLADLHLNMRTTAQETGADWNLKEATQLTVKSFTRLVAKSDNTETAILLNLGDFFHTNDAKNATPRSGNILDVDAGYMPMLVAGAMLMIELIEIALQKHKTVIVRNIPGNHDPESSVALTVALWTRFHAEPRVQLDMRHDDFFFHRFGTTLIGANHGHRLKPVDMALKLATERADDWGKSKYRYFYFGHIHHETLKEIGGVRVESFQTLSPKDKHANDGGYVSGRSLTAISIHESDGEIGRHRVNL